MENHQVISLKRINYSNARALWVKQFQTEGHGVIDAQNKDDVDRQTPHAKIYRKGSTFWLGPTITIIITVVALL